MMRLCACGIACLFLVSAISMPTPVEAANRFWITPTGGFFGTPGLANVNWSATDGGAGGATVPGAADTAFFTLNNTYDITLSVAVTNQSLNVHRGNVTLDLDGLTYTGTSGIAILAGGESGQTGRLTVTNGTMAVDTAGDNVQMGTVNNSTGFLTIGTGGQLGTSGTRPGVFPGMLGTGTLTVQNDGQVFAGLFIVANSPGTTGTVSITGAQASVDVSSILTIGDEGVGTMTISGGGNLLGAGSATIGGTSGSAGTLTITGIGSTWTQSTTMTVGSNGVGTLNVQSGGSLSTGLTNIGSNIGSFGAATITGNSSAWSISSSLTVGSAGEGTLTVSSGGQLSTTSSATIGSAGSSQGAVTVTGNDSRLNVGSSITVGSSGAGSLTISASGQVTSTSGTIGGSGGQVTITGPGSAWTTTGSVNVAAGSGSGTLTVESGGSFSGGSTLTISDPVGAPLGTLNFNGGTISVPGFVRSGGAVFNWTDGTLSIVGGTFNNAGAAFTLNGADANDRPTPRLTTGSTTLGAQMGALTVGNDDGAALEVTGGSVLQVPSISIGAADGGDGIVTVSGNLSSMSATLSNINVGGTGSAAGGMGTLNIETGAVANTAIAGQLRMWAGGTVNVNGGTLLYGAITFNGGKVNFNSGRIEQFNNLTADENTLTTLLGAAHELRAARTLATAGTATVSANLDVNGGRLEGNVLSVASVGVNSTVFRVRGGGVGQFSNGVQLGADTRTFVEDGGTLNAGTIITQLGELYLSGTGRVSGSEFNNLGLVAGSGRIDANLDNATSGEVRIAAGERIVFDGSSHANDGTIDVNGGELEFAAGAVTNSTSSPSTGLIAARNATLRFDGGLTNNGAMTFTAGVSDVFGEVSNTNALATPGRIIVSGGAQATFFDDVTNSGTIQVSAAGSLQSTVVFLGSFSGNGASGGGHAFLEGDVRPGFSPGTMAFGGDLSFGPLASLEIELAGTNPGSKFDQVTVADSLALAGMLDVTLIGGFTPNPGDAFDIVTAAGGITGTFASEALPALAGGLFFDVQYSPTVVSLIATGLLGDYNFDGVVDAADYLVWRKTLGQSGIGLAADGNANGQIDPDDYGVWRAHFGQTAGSGAAGPARSNASVPEPPTQIILVMAMMLTFARRPIEAGEANSQDSFSHLAATAR